MIGVVVGDNQGFIMRFYPDGNLANALYSTSHARRDFSFIQRLQCCRDLAAGIDHLHKRDIIHRDIAARNCLIQADGSIVIADFGLSRKLERERDINTTFTNEFPYK